MVQLAHPAGDAKEILHHVLDRLVAFAFVTQAAGDAELPVEQQTIIVAVELQMQRKANAPQLMQAFVKLVTLGFGQETEADHFIKRGGTEMAARDPLQGVNIAQAAGAAFHVRLEVIAGPVIALMAYILLFDFCRKELFRWPEAVAEYVLLQFKEQRDVANKQTRFNQVSGDAEVRQPLQQALFEGAHAVADFQLDIPQQRQQLADLLRLLIGQLLRLRISRSISESGCSSPRP